MLSSLSNGSSGPRPVISSRISRDEVVELLGVERQPLGQYVLRNQLLDVAADLVLGQFFQRREIDLLDQPAVQAHLGVEQLVALQQRSPAARRRAPARPETP